MNININPNLESLLATTASGQGLTPEQFVEHHIEKHLVASLRNETVELLKKLNVNEIAQIKTDVSATLESKIIAIEEPIV